MDAASLRLRLLLLLLSPILVNALDPVVPIPESVKEEIDGRVKSHKNPSIAIGVYDDGEIEYYVAGYANVDDRTKADEDTVYDLGSITKTLTGLLLGKLVAEDKVRLWDPVHKFMPSYELADPETGAHVQLVHLATHTSGMPKTPDNLEDTVEDDDNPFADYARQDLEDFLDEYVAENVGREYRYSHVGYAVLGEALADSQGKNYRDLLQSEVLGPLGVDFFTDVPEDKQDNLAKGHYYRKSKHKSYTLVDQEYDVMAPSRGLHSNIKDLLAYGIGMIKDEEMLDDASLEKGVRLAEQIYFTDGGIHPDQSLGWHVHNRVLRRSGGARGFKSSLNVDLDNRRAVAVLTNTHSYSVTSVAAMIIPYEDY